MGCWVLGFEKIDRTRAALVGGKGANLGELARIEGVRVPPGFCVTTEAFRRVMAEAPSIEERFDRLSRLGLNEREAIRTLSAEIRETIEGSAIPDGIAAAIVQALARHGDDGAYAVRSSATAEDLPGASFAGQQESYLNVIGQEAILAHVRRCWASLFTERAVTYRIRNGIDQSKVQMAVVVQRMVFPQASGILFTADPVSGNRKVASIEASFGLGEALVSGLVNADVFKVRDGEIVAMTISDKRLAIEPAPAGGTRQAVITPERRERPALTDAQAVRLAELGRRIEARFGRPQDIEWCLVDGEFQIVQSRPITTLFPIPQAADDEHHVYLSVGHQQMMTDAMKPLGISVWQLSAGRPMHEAGGRLFVDVSQALATPAGQAGLQALAGRSDPLTGDALRTIVERGFIPTRPDDAPAGPPSGPAPAPIETDPAIVDELIARYQASLAALRDALGGLTGPALLDFILADFAELKRVLFDPLSHQAIMAGMEAAWRLNDLLEERLGEKNAADALTQSVPNNVTSEMGLALLDVADAIRPHPEVIALLERTEDEDFLDELPKVAGGRKARDAILAWLDQYGMRGAGEIDITRPRWRERPAMLVPVILGNVRNFAPGDGKRRFAAGLQAAEAKEREVLERLRALPDGAEQAAEVKRLIDRVRTFAGYREHPKYALISRYFIYKQALLEEAERLARAGVLREREDIFFLTLPELRDAVHANVVDDALIQRRKEAFRTHQALMPPRVLTSEGEAVAGAYRRGALPAGALVGLPVSAGLVEGRARVIIDMAEANLEPGDILVTAYTDPSWTPLFVAIAGLVTEVGGLMTHGSVIAREYGVPAVVGVEGATGLIRDGQRIRVHGAEGYVEIVPERDRR